MKDFFSKCEQICNSLRKILNGKLNFFVQCQQYQREQVNAHRKPKYQTNPCDYNRKYNGQLKNKK